MTDTVELLRNVIALRPDLKKGDKRELARRMGTYPSRIGDAFDGFSRNPEFLSKLVAETEKLISERKPITA
jgi:hypothetical protein